MSYQDSSEYYGLDNIKPIKGKLPDFRREKEKKKKRQKSRRLREKRRERLYPL